MKYEQLERRTLMNQSSTLLCLHIVKKIHNLRFCEFLLHLKALYERLYFSSSLHRDVVFYSHMSRSMRFPTMWYGSDQPAHMGSLIRAFASRLSIL